MVPGSLRPSTGVLGRGCRGPVTGRGHLSLCHPSRGLSRSAQAELPPVIVLNCVMPAAAHLETKSHSESPNPISGPAQHKWPKSATARALSPIARNSSHGPRLSGASPNSLTSRAQCHPPQWLPSQDSGQQRTSHVHPENCLEPQGGHCLVFLQRPARGEEVRPQPGLGGPASCAPGS